MDKAKSIDEETVESKININIQCPYLTKNLELKIIFYNLNLDSKEVGSRTLD